MKCDICQEEFSLQISRYTRCIDCIKDGLVETECDEYNRVKKKNKKPPCDNINCKLCFNKSIAGKTINHKYWTGLIKDKNDNILFPRYYCYKGRTSFKITCKICHHTMFKRVEDGCRFCTGKELCYDFGCNFCILKSVYPLRESLISRGWDSSQYLNLHRIILKGDTLISFKCIRKDEKSGLICNHYFLLLACEIKDPNKWCPYCYTRTKICENKKCKICIHTTFDKYRKELKERGWDGNLYTSDITIDGARQYDPYQIDMDRVQNTWEISYGSGKFYGFGCNKCKHIFISSIRSVTVSKSWCSYCNGDIVCSRLDCEFCKDDRFTTIIPSLKYWDGNVVDENDNKVNLHLLRKRSNKKFFFGCKICDKPYETSLDNLFQKRWCGCSTHKTERDMEIFLDENIIYDFQRNYRADWCRKPTIDKRGYYNKLPFDFACFDKNIIIEIDGDTHFKDVKKWKTKAVEERANDIYKMKCAIDNGYKIIRLLQEEVYYDHFNWQLPLINTIYNIDKIPDKVIFIAKNISKYDNHIREMKNVIIN